MPRHFKHCLVTGGAGFIGSNLVDLLLARLPDARVSAFDALTYAGRRENLEHLACERRFRLIEGNLNDRAAVSAALEGVDVCFHLAAETHVDRSIETSRPFLETNVMGTGNLLDAARERKLTEGHPSSVPPQGGIPLLVLIGTDEVYGSIDQGSHVETDRLNPSNPYSASKASADLLALSYRTTHGLPVMITRCTNNYGPRQFPEKLIPFFLSRALQDQPLPVYGNGGNIRDWLHVEDHCEALLTVAQKGDLGEIYNVGGGHEASNLEITHLLLAQLGKPQSLVRYVEDRPGHDLRYSLRWDKLAALGWQPRHRFADGIAQTVAWYRDNEEWLERIRRGSEEHQRFQVHCYQARKTIGHT